MRSIVIGSGELATAVSLSVIANYRAVTMRCRDPTVLRENKHFSAFRAMDCISLPERGFEMSTIGSSSPPLEYAANAIFVCTPSSALRTEKEQESCAVASKNTSRGKSSTVIVRPSLVNDIAALIQQSVELSQKKNALEGDGARLSSGPAVPTVVVMSRGLGRDGTTPTSRLHQHFAASGERLRKVSLIGVASCFGAREWALDCHKQSKASTYHPYGVASMCCGAGEHATFQSRSLIEGLFQRESVYWLNSEGDGQAAEAICLLNAMCMMLSFGAGLVSNEYPSNLSATTSYFAHALHSVERLLPQLVGGRSQTQAADGSPTSSSSSACPVQQLLARKKTGVSNSGVSSMSAPGVAAAVMHAVTHQGSKEFALGRQMRSQFRQHDALRATFSSGNEHLASLDDTMEGLYVRMKAAEVASPFFEGIMDAYSTYRRADDVGRQLIKLGCYDTKEEDARMSREGSLLSHMQAMDRSVESGKGQDEATQSLITRHGGAMLDTKFPV